MDDIDFASYADDNTPYTIGMVMEDVNFKLQIRQSTFSMVYG